MATTYVTGQPCWIDCGTDLEKAPAFYAGLFGWEVTSLGPDAGGYAMASLGGKEVAGFGPKQDAGPPRWSVYFATDDADKTTQLATEHGATVVMPPTDVMTAGRMAVLVDPLGAAFSLWQPGDHAGFGVATGPGAFNWAELVTTDTERAADFYRSVLGVTTKTSSEGGIDYTELQVDGTSVAGMMRKPPEMPAEMGPFWGVYFSVADTDGTLAKVAELGGMTVAGPMELSVGKFAACVDTVGALFNVIQPATTS